MNQASLISQLKIQREAPSPLRERRRSIWPWAAAGLGVAAMAAGAVWFFVARPDLVAVETASAEPVSTAEAAQGRSLLDASGYVVPQRQATVSSKVTGKVIQVLIEEGQRVQAGQIIARLDDSNARAALDQATAQVAVADASHRLAQASLAQQGRTNDRNQRLHEKGFLSDNAADDARNAYDNSSIGLDLAARQAQVARAALEIAKRNLDDTVVRAPFDGVVTVKAAQPGEMVSPISAGGGFTRTGIGTIVDMNSLEVEVDVAESFINRVSQGMPATVTLNAYRGWRIPAEVVAVIPTADRSKATVSVRVGFKIKDPRIVPEMGAHVAFESAAPSAAAGAVPPRGVVVPAGAVQSDNGGPPVVYVIAGGIAERRSVRLGDKGSAGQIVLAGLAPGEVVAAAGASRLKAGAKVRITKTKTKVKDQ